MTNEEKLSKLLEVLSIDAEGNIYIDAKIVAQNVIIYPNHWVNAENSDVVVESNVW